MPNTELEFHRNPGDRGGRAARFIGGLLLGVAAMLSAWQAQAQDLPTRGKVPKVVLTASGPRTSPFEPPSKDVFLTDASPGLDTGCTFNSSPLNPLTIDIPVDKFVGDVDANGFLVNPAPLVAAGLIPAAIDILMPAFDVDFNGTPPPERDEVLFNGQSLGFLTGENNVWKLNTFRVDIRKVRFPSRPAANASPVPVNNRIQIRIDTLGVNRWCTSIDWVALVLPIRPKLALDLAVVSGSGGNPVHGDATGTLISKIQEQTFDAACNVRTSIGPIEDYPFSAPATTGSGGTGSVKLRAKVKACPEGSLGTPDVTANWAVDATSRRGEVTWRGAEGDVEFLMPSAVGPYTASLKLTLDNGQDVRTTRRLFVTLKPTLSPGGLDPRANWYRKGVEWATGETDATRLVGRVMSGVYGYGSAWVYAEDGPSCNWDDLMRAPSPMCNYGNCYIFSDVLQNISRTLGVDGMTAIREEGTRRRGFVTRPAPSLDRNWPGNVAPSTSLAAFDRYLFSTHSLRKRGPAFYDATFNGTYATQQQFIGSNLTGARATDAIGRYLVTVEGPRIYGLSGAGYHNWGEFAVLLNPPRPAGATTASPAGMMRTATRATSLTFPSINGYRTPDVNGDRRFEALEVDVDVDVSAAGDYSVTGELLDASDQLVANRPAFNSMQFTRASFSAAGPGRRTITLKFSGEQIRQSRTDGPYTLALYANSSVAEAGSGRLPTSAFRWVDFGELKGQLRSMVVTPLDRDGSGRFETVSVSFDVDAAAAGPYQLGATIAGQGQDLVSRSRLFMLAEGSQTLTIDLPATGIARSGINGPYDVSGNLAEANGAAIDSQELTTGPLLASQFEGVVEVSNNLVEQTIDSNANGLFDLLRVAAEVRVRAPQGALVHANLVAANGASIGVDTVASLQTAPGQRVSFDFSGPRIRSLQMDSQYNLELSFRSPTTFEEFDAVRVPMRGVYVHTRFDPAEAPRAISLNGTRTDRGIDTNGNGLFDTLQVDLGVDLLRAGTCEWSARLVDRNGLELGFAASSGSLAAGSGIARLNFPGRGVGLNGLDGPYSVRSMLMACADGANLVATFAAETSAWRASQFEGYSVRLPGDLNGDGRVDSADVTEFNRALGSSVGDPTYNRFADFDRDGRITLNDLRLFRRYLPR